MEATRKISYQIAGAVEGAGVSQATLNNEVQAGRLNSLKLGSATLITADPLRAWLAERGLPLDKILNVLHDMGHTYETITDKYDQVVVACLHHGEGGPYKLAFDTSRGEIPLADLYDQLEIAGVDLAAFNTLLDALG